MTHRCALAKHIADLITLPYSPPHDSHGHEPEVESAPRPGIALSQPQARRSPPPHAMAAPRPPPDADGNRSRELLTVTWIFCALSSLVVGLRLYVRVRMTRNLWWDDWVMFFTMVRGNPRRGPKPPPLRASASNVCCTPRPSQSPFPPSSPYMRPKVARATSYP